MNIPDGYRFLLIDNSLVKLFRSFDGGFAIGESWMLNSGCTKIIPVDDYWQVYGYSGSMYTIRKEQGRLNSYTSGVFQSIIKKLKDGGVPVQEVNLATTIEILNNKTGDNIGLKGCS